MIVVQVTYTVPQEYIATNKKRIFEFLHDFKTLDNAPFQYTVFQKDDLKTFVHLSQYQNKEIQERVLNTPRFLYFQAQRDAHLETEPLIEILTAIGSSKEIF